MILTGSWSIHKRTGEIKTEDHVCSCVSIATTFVFSLLLLGRTSTLQTIQKTATEEESQKGKSEKGKQPQLTLIQVKTARTQRVPMAPTSPTSPNRVAMSKYKSPGCLWGLPIWNFTYGALVLCCSPRDEVEPQDQEMPGDQQRALLIRQYTTLVTLHGKDIAEKFRAQHELCLPQKGDMLLVRGTDQWYIVFVKVVRENEGDGELEYIGPYYKLPPKGDVFCLKPKGIADHYVVGYHIYSILDGNYTWEGQTDRSKRLKVPQILRSLWFLRKEWVEPEDPIPDISGFVSE